MTPRIHLPMPFDSGVEIDLPPDQARHVQVLRLQPGDSLTLFNGDGGEWQARITEMTRRQVTVELDVHVAVDRELSRSVTLAVGMPANERMDALIEKATELGAAAIQPLICERSVLRLTGDRAAKRLAHWRGIAVAASEQSGRTRLLRIHAVQSLSTWLEGIGEATRAAPAESRPRRLLLSPGASTALSTAVDGLNAEPIVFLSGPEGGLSASEEADAERVGFAPVTMGRLILRADTAPLAALAHCALTELG